MNSERTVGAKRRGDVRLITVNVPGFFFRRASAMATLHRVTLVAPWIALGAGAPYGLNHLLDTVQRRRAEVRLLTRPPVSEQPWHKEAIVRIDALPRSQVYTHPLLHAKFYVAESAMGSFAIVGSANLTPLGSTAREVGMAMSDRGVGGELIPDLVVLAQAIRADRQAQRWKGES